jgi:hypothetical protein
MPMSLIRVSRAWSLLLALTVCGTLHAASPGQPDAYPRMAPLEQYLIASRDAEIALARSAAPASISAGAKVLILGKRGYETAAPGSNGFTCLVERSWMNPFDSTEFWNPRYRTPVCYNPAASRSVLPYTLYRTSLLLMGSTNKEQLLEQIRAAVAQKTFAVPEPGSMSYMMSKQQHFSDEAGAWHSHLMFHIPRTETASWGANLPGSPVIADTDHTEAPEPQTIFMVAVAHWSDGTPSPLH